MSAALPTRTSPRSQSPRFSALNRGKGANTLLAANTAYNATISSASGTVAVPSTPPIGPAERFNASSTPQSKPAAGTFRAYNMLRSPHLQQQQIPSKAHVPWTSVQIFYRFGLLGLFNGVAFMIFSVFSRPAFARGLVFVASMGLLVACVTFYRARDWRIFRILVIPTTLAVGSELGVAVEWLPSDTHLFAAAFFGVLVALTMVVLSVCGPSPRSIRVQYVATAIGIVAPPVACVLSLLTPSTIFYTMGIFASMIASSFNLLFNKA